MKNLKLKVGIIDYDFDKIINHHIRKESRQEAKNILTYILKESSKGCPEAINDLMEFIIYVERDMGNIICLHLGAMKNRLIKKGIKIKGQDFGTEFLNIKEK